MMLLFNSESHYTCTRFRRISFVFFFCGKVSIYGCTILDLICATQSLCFVFFGAIEWQLTIFTFWPFHLHSERINRQREFIRMTYSWTYKWIPSITISKQSRCYTRSWEQQGTIALMVLLSTKTTVQVEKKMIYFSDIIKLWTYCRYFIFPDAWTFIQNFHCTFDP